jgi:hypothetical protein
MTSLRIDLDGENAWGDMCEHEIIYGEWEAVGFLPRNIESTNAVAIRVKLPDGNYVLGQTTAKLFVAAGRAINAKMETLEGENWLDL